MVQKTWHMILRKRHRVREETGNKFKEGGQLLWHRWGERSFNRLYFLWFGVLGCYYRAKNSNKSKKMEQWVGTRAIFFLGILIMVVIVPGRQGKAVTGVEGKLD